MSTFGKEAPKPNFLFILVDDLGKEWISCYGAKGINTPRIDRLAHEGMRFERAYSMPQSTPSRIALMTGKYPYHNGWINHFDVPRWGHGASYDVNLNGSFGCVLRDAGYRTCAAGKWQVNDFRLEPKAMVTAGFDEYCMWTGGEGGNELASNKRYWDPYIHTKEGSRTYEGKFGPDVFSDFIVDFMRKHKDEPMCIYYPMVLTHIPFTNTPHEPDATTIYEKHCAMVRYTDYITGKLADEIDRLGIADNTYIILTSDNGTAGIVVGQRNDSFIRGGKTYLTENGINAPFIVRGPGITKGSVSQALVDFADLYPTLLELAGVSCQNGSSIDGVSFAGALRGGPGARNWATSLGGQPAMIGPDRMVKSYYNFRDRAIIGEKYKVYVDTLRRIEHIFEMAIDPWEENDLISDPVIVKEVGRIFAPVIDAMPLRDENPHYRKLSGSLYDEPVEKINAASKRGNSRNTNMLPRVKENDFMRFRNSKQTQAGGDD